MDRSFLEAFDAACGAAARALPARDEGAAPAAIRRAPRLLPLILDDDGRQGDLATAPLAREGRGLERAEKLALRGRFKAARVEVDAVSYCLASWVLRRRPWRPTRDGTGGERAVVGA
ncbi:MAG: hypothetical protein IMW98_07665 [Firmicutes bacterium]|nr:hypothetical protein [Bacillota bacterium]